MEVILLWKKTKKKFGLLIYPNIITEQWGLCLFVQGNITLEGILLTSFSFRHGLKK